MITALAFIAVFLVIVLIHEWGHFFTARKTGMRVDEFGFGLPPRLWSWKGKKTLYSINALPIGGFVRIAGENGEEEEVPKNEQFDSKPWYAKSLVLVAGVVCNVILGFVLFFGAYFVGVPVLNDNGIPTILMVSPEGAAEKAGISVGDTLLSISQNGQSPDSISTESVHEFLQNTEGSLSVEYSHEGVTKEVEITPTQTDNGRLFGIMVEPVSKSTPSFSKALVYAWHQTIDTLTLVFTTVSDLLAKLFTHPSAEGVMGPVGLVKTVGSAAHIGIAYLLAIAAALSLNLAVINILPLPALDGGRLIIVLLEAITKKKFSRKIVSLIHAFGFILLFVLMIVLTIHDIRG